MQQWIYVLKPARLGMVTEGSTPEEAEIVSRHFAYLKNNDENTFGVAIFEAQDEAHAQAIMENDPAVKNGVMTATLYPYRIALMRT